MKLQKERAFPAGLPALLLMVGALLLLLYALGNLQTDSAAEGQRQLTESLYRATVSCYALEGRYPPDIAYLQAHYGIQVDASRYTVFYEVIGDNLMPDIRVLAS